MNLLGKQKPALDRTSGHASSSNSPQNLGPLGNTTNFIRLNQSLYQLHVPTGRPIMQVLFFHGFQFGDYEDAHLSTWKSRDGTCIWPQTWLIQKFPDAQILSVSYNSHLKDWAKHGNSDMYIIKENLLYDLMKANIGQLRNCPIILVGHSFGGLVIKQLCLYADDMVHRKSDNECMNFLQRLSGIFYYATPHHGSQFVDKATHILGGPLLEYVKTLSTQGERLNYEFDELCGKYTTWLINGLGESIPTKSGPIRGMVVVPEASSRSGQGFNVVEDADHMSICNPINVMSRSFYTLADFLGKVRRDFKVEPEEQIAINLMLPEYFVDDNDRVELVVKSLQLQDPEPLCLAILGMGGIGKTTVAKAVVIKLSGRFEFVCFVKDVKEEMKRQSLEELVQESLYRGHIKVHQVEHSSPWTLLKGKKLLLVMDDVDSGMQTEKVISLVNQQPSWFGEGSRVIATSRSRQDFPHNFQFLELEFLNQIESEKLFRSHLELEVKREIPEALVERVVKKCDGLPLTLEVIGSYLSHENNEEVWSDAIESLTMAEALGGASNDKLWAKLKLSFESLAPTEQNMFLDMVALYNVINGRYLSFSSGIEFLKGAWMSGGHGPHKGLKNLRDRGFIRMNKEWGEFQYRQKRDITVWIHQQLRDMAASIASPRSLGTEHWSRVWHNNDVMDLLLLHKESLATEVLWLEEDESRVMNLRWDSLARMENLRLLSLQWWSSRIRIHGSGNRFPSSLALLTLIHCCSGRTWSSSEDWPIRERDLKCLTNLGALHIVACKPLRLPRSFHKLLNLRVFELSNNELKQLPTDFGRLPSLESLLIRAEPMKFLPESFGCLSKLRYLVLEYMPNLCHLPGSFGLLSSLQGLRLEYLEKLTELPGNFGKLSHLRTLVLHVCDQLERLPSSFGQLGALQTLDITECNLLQRLPDSFGKLGALQTLHISCDLLERLPDSFGQLLVLKNLAIGFVQLTELPGSFGMLSCLETLQLLECSNLDRLPDNFGKLDSLQHVVIGGCPRLKLGAVSLPKSLREIHEKSRKDKSHGEFEVCPLVTELEGLGWISSPCSSDTGYDSSWISRHSAYKYTSYKYSWIHSRPDDASC